MAWTQDLPAADLAVSLLNLRLKAERLRVESNIHSLAQRAQALGAPAVDLKALFNVAAPHVVTYELPPLRYLEVKSGGSF
jgi:hypothetical protein